MILPDGKKTKRLLNKKKNKKKIVIRKLKTPKIIDVKPKTMTEAMPLAVLPNAYGKMMAYHKESSLAGNSRQGGLGGGGLAQRIRPRIDFWKRHEYYLTVGRVMNVTEAFVLNIINREWYYDSTEEGNDIEDSIHQMEAWEEQVVVTKFIANLTRSWIIDGVFIVSPVDWQPIQLQSLVSKSRDKEGNTTEYQQVINGVEHRIKAKDFLEIPYIDFDREPWGVGMFDSLMNRDYIDIDGRDPRASLELYRQALQDNMKIHHKYASPRVIYTAEGVSKETLDNDIIPVIEGMMPGDRAAFNANIVITQETVDGNARFIEHVNKIIDEIDTGLQSSSNRLITEPSAMADAREAGSQDDDRTLGIMERIRILFNREIIPRITGRAPGEVIFKWGAKDAFDLEFPEPIEKALKANLMAPEQALVMLMDQWHWKIPSPEEAFERLNIKPAKAETPQQLPTDEERPQAIEMKVRTEMQEKMVTEQIKAEKEIKNHKIMFYNEMARKLKEI